MHAYVSVGGAGRGGSVLHSTTADIKRDFFGTFLFVCLFGVKIVFAFVFANVLLGNRRERVLRFGSSKGPKGHFNEVGHLSQVDVRHSAWARRSWSIWIALNVLRAHVHGGSKRTVWCNKQQLE